MSPDPRIKLILDHVIAAAREVRPEMKGERLENMQKDDIEIVTVALKVFDRMLPMLVTLILAEVNRQKAQPQPNQLKAAET